MPANNGKISLNAVPVLHALARSHGPAAFAELRDATGLAQATLNRILKQLCDFGYAVKVGHGQYLAGPELVDMGVSITRNHVVPAFKNQLAALKRRTRLNAELYVITPNGPVYLTHSPARGEEALPFQFGHVIRNRSNHPAALFYLAMQKGQKPDGYRENFIVDRGGQWPELFRAAAMIPGSNYCLALSGMLTSVAEERHAELKEALHAAGRDIELPGDGAARRRESGPSSINGRNE